jgi:dTDP-4-dehydrorhamnose 3,5-epimerase-like enzyme
MNILPTLISGQEIRNHGGVISVWEPVALPIEFEFKRVYFLHDLDPGITRGHHAHKELWQILLVMGGRFSIEVWDRRDSKFSFELEAFGDGLLIPPGYWRIFQPLAAQSSMAVFASHEYLEADYIRSLDEFYRWQADD